MEEAVTIYCELRPDRGASIPPRFGAVQSVAAPDRLRREHVALAAIEESAIDGRRRARLLFTRGKLKWTVMCHPYRIVEGSLPRLQYVQRAADL